MVKNDKEAGKETGLQASIKATLDFAHRSGAWIVRDGPASPQPSAAEDSPKDLPIISSPQGGELALIREEIGECTRCRLHTGRTHIVFGVGNPKARLLFVGEGPGRDEDRQGEPFVGRAGMLLNRMIAAMGFKREEIYIANVVKCRPPGNRDPREDEVEQCIRFLWEQIDAIKPDVICALGAHAARNLTGRDEPIGRMRGSVIRTRGWNVVATYHPAYLLRNPAAKRLAWQDLQLVLAKLND